METELELEVRSERFDETARLARAAVACGIADEAVVAQVREGTPLVSATAAVEESSDGFWEAFKRFFTGTTFQELTRTRQRLRWPLFFLGCPDVADAELSVALRAQRTAASGFSLKLLGSGFDRCTSLTAAVVHQATAARGQQRLLYLRHDVDHVTYALLRPDRHPVEGLRLELVPDTHAIGVMDMSRPPPWSLPAAAVRSLDYRHALPTARQKFTWEEEYKRTSALALGTDDAPLTLGASFGYELTTTVTLEADLPGGADWSLMAPEHCAGLFARSER